jgi:alkylation response protein AidB-like acyl-CoA dehydrogenase
MNFDFTPEQLMLRQMTRELLAGECPPPVVRQLMDDPAGYREETWRQLAELGLLGITIPEAYGGQGLGPVELALVLEEMGRAVYPGPYFASVVLAATALLAGGSEAQRERYLTGIAAGSTKATLALWEGDASWGMRGIGAVARPAAPDGAGYVLQGAKRLVPYAHVADVLLVAARTEGSEGNGSPGGRGLDGGADGGVTLFAVERETPGLEVRPLGTIDQTTRVGEVVLRDVEVGGDQVVGPVGGASPILEGVLRQAAVGACAEMLGAARKALEMSVEYARSREQFGQPIGSFQAVKHTCAEMLLEVEQAHAATYYAAWALSAGAPDAALAASVAKAYVGGAARKVCGDAIQVHGGIGFTWEFDLHLSFKRAKHLEPLYGDADFHRERALALTLAGEGAAEGAPLRAGARESAIAG